MIPMGLIFRTRGKYRKTSYRRLKSLRSQVVLNWYQSLNIKRPTRWLVTLGRQGFNKPHPLSDISQSAKVFGFTEVMVDVGTSYFRRLMQSNSSMLVLAKSCPYYGHYVQTAEEFPKEQISSPFVGVRHARFLTTNAWLTLIILTCIYLAAKVIEHVPYKNLLSTMMSYSYGAEVHQHWAAELELEILQALDWRLGPVYSNSVVQSPLNYNKVSSEPLASPSF